jgi:tetratricopeptide (TPR) repeat protein
MSSYHGICKSSWKIFQVGWVSGLLICLVALFLGSGCAKSNLVKESVPVERWTCDRDADEALKRRDYGESILLHQRFLEKEPENALALYHLGYAYGQTGDHEKEIFYYENAVGLGFKGEHIFFNLGMAYGELNRIEEAVNAFQEALDINPDSAENHFGLALAYQRSVADKLAEEEFLRAIEIDPAHVDARLYLSMLYADRGELQKAAGQLRNILRIDPHHRGAQEFLENIEKE